MSTSTTISEEASVSSGPRTGDGSSLKPRLPNCMSSHYAEPPELKPKKKRNKPGNPDPGAEVVALSPTTLMSTNRYPCEVCGKGFQREQNLQLHRRGHNLPWKLRPSDGNAASARKKVYVCPEATCAHHQPSRALGDLTGIKKHFWRKHGEKRWACERCFKKYAVLSDWKAHIKTCGTREYRCDCGAIFSRKDSFATHRAFCDALAAESARMTTGATVAAAAASADTAYNPLVHHQRHQPTEHQLPFSSWDHLQNPNPNSIRIPPYSQLVCRSEDSPVHHQSFMPSNNPAATRHLSGTALLQTGSTTGLLATTSISCAATLTAGVAGLGVGDVPPWQRGDCLLTRDFLGMTGEGEEDLLSLTDSSGLSGGLDFMASSAAAACGCSGHATSITTETKPEPAGELGFHHLSTPATSASQAWWRLLQP